MERKYIDIEFVDTKGMYRRWRSHLDGGKVEYKGKKSKKDLFKKEGVLLKQRFYDHHCGRFFVYFDEVNSEVITKGIIHYLMNGYVMDVTDDGTGGKMYVLFSVEMDTDGISGLHACKGILRNLLNECGVQYFTTISLRDYHSNVVYQNAIDYVLEKACYHDNYIDGWSIALFINNNGEFEFVEVLNACE